MSAASWRVWAAWRGREGGRRHRCLPRKPSSAPVVRWLLYPWGAQSCCSGEEGSDHLCRHGCGVLGEELVLGLWRVSLLEAWPRGSPTPPGSPMLGRGAVRSRPRERGCWEQQGGSEGVERRMGSCSCCLAFSHLGRAVLHKRTANRAGFTVNRAGHQCQPELALTVQTSWAATLLTQTTEIDEREMDLLRLHY